jgi:tetratricopeptide (TPR) repeat protein
MSELQHQANAYLAQQQYDKAIALYNQSIESDPGLMSNYWYLGLALLLHDQESEAQLTWMSAISQGDSTQMDDWTVELVNILTTEALRHEAIPNLDLAWAIRQYIREFDPDNINNLLGLIWLPLELGMDATQTDLSHLSLLLSENIEAIDEIDIDLLYQALVQLVMVNPFHDLHTLCFEQLEQIINSDDRFLAVKRELSLAHVNLGLFQFNRSRFDQAFRNFQTAIAIYPFTASKELAELNFNMGISLYRQGDFGRSQEYFQQSANLDFTPAQLYLARAKCEDSNQIKGYQFTQDWFGRNLLIWEELLLKFANLPNLCFLELGSWEGRATCWLLDRILTHRSSRLTCIDTFEGEDYLGLEASYLKTIEARFDFNIAQTGSPEKIEKIVGKTLEAMRSLPKNFYDFLYIDASHLACDVLADTVMAWYHVKIGGLIIFDDYDKHFPDNPDQDTRKGIDAFVSVFAPKLKIVHQSHQLAIEKIAD